MRSIRRGTFVLAAAVVGLATCGKSSDDESTVRSELTGPITISGSITDANGLPLPGVTVHLDGTSQAVQIPPDGNYSFSGLFAGSYSVRPTKQNCSFVPDVVNMNNLTASRVQNFSGSGPGCGGTPSVNTGATSGSLTISGLVRDSANRPVVNVRIDLGGATQAIRFSDSTGGYTFRVDPGTYSLTASGACSVTPQNVNFNNMTANRVQNFTAGTGCMVTQISNVASTGQMMRISQNGALLAVTLANAVTTTTAATTARLQDIVSERPQGVRNLTIAGFPAIERQTLVDAKEKDLEMLGGGGDADAQIWLTTAIAAGNTIVRFEAQLPENASAATIDSFFRIGRNFSSEQIARLRGPAPPAVPPGIRSPAVAQPALPPNLTPASVGNGFGEVAMAATSSATQAVVYAMNPGRGSVFFSTNGGATINASTLSFLARESGLVSRGDPIMAVGAPAPMTGAQNLYYGQILQVVNQVLPNPMAGIAGAPFRMEIVTLQSGNNGSAFSQRGLIIDCSVLSNNCTIPDQPMLVADRVTQSSTGGDRLYVAYRNFIQSSNPMTPQNSVGAGIAVACSPDGGTTWSAPNVSAITAAGADFPRVDVGPDGSMYVIYSIGASAEPATGIVSIYVQKFTACNNSGATPTISASGNPTRIASAGEAAIVPGVDRRPTLGQYAVAADDSDTTGQRVFAVWIDNVANNANGTGNANVRFAESTNGGSSFRVSQFFLNRTQTGYRYHPAICSTKGIAYVSWYDRRNASATSNDLTSYVYTNLTDVGNTGNPQIGNEVNATGPNLDDPQCQSGFLFSNLFGSLGAPISGASEGACTGLPALPTVVAAGTCQQANCGTAGIPACSNQFCDFRAGAPACPNMGETCTPGVGSVKYGDYNGSACGGGNLFMAWASAVPPQGITCAPAGAACSTSANCCNGGICASGVCSPNGFTCTANGQACANNNNALCCSGNCLGGTCQLGIGLYASSTAVATPLTCDVPNSTPDISFNTPFAVDTTITPPAGGSSGYGQATCPSQYMVGVDLTQPAFQGKDLVVVGTWSSTLAPTPCNYQAIMNVYVTTDNMTWTLFDRVVYAGVMQGPLCNPQAQSHTDPGSANLDATNVPAARGFAGVRVTVTATQGNALVPVAVDGQAL